MSTIATLIESIMSAGAVNIVPIKLGQFEARSQQPEKKFVIVALLQNGAGNFFEVGRTGEIATGNGAVELHKTLQIPYKFAELQRLKLAAYESTEDENEEAKEVGCAIMTLGRIVSTKDIKVKLSNEIGSIQIATNRIADSRSIILDVCAEKLEKKDLFGKSDPYLEISRKDDDGTWSVVHRTEHLKDTHNPHWAEFTLSYQLLCGTDISTDVKFACYDYDRNGNHDLIGDALIAPSQILENNSSQTFALSNINKKKQKKKGLGRLIIKKCKVKKETSFISYMLAGCQLHFTSGIDFTGSNGDPQQNSSLHYTGSATPNKYVLSLRAIGRILQEYTCERQISSYGYGAKIPPDNEVSHDFPLDQESSNGVFAGMEELIGAYNKTLSLVKLWGPTNFAPIINKVCDAAEASENGKMDYHVLLMLTDGVVTDVDDTKCAIVRASKLPISMIVIGIGNADFSEMDFLNKRNKLLKSPTGDTATRHISKCVTFRNFNLTSMDTLTQNLLDEIPFQVLEYFTMNGIYPEEQDNGVPDANGKTNAALEVLKNGKAAIASKLAKSESVDTQSADEQISAL